MATPKNTTESDVFNTNSQMNPQLAKVISFMQRNILLFIGVIALLISFTMMNNTLDSRSDTLLKQEAEIQQLTRDLNTTRASVDDKYDQSIADAIGVDIKLKAQHDKIAEDLMRMALTWDGLPAYLQARDQVKSKYKFTDDSPFMKTFMPGELQGVTRTDPTGKVHYAYDANLSSDFGKLKSYVLKADGDTYSYFAVVESNHYSEDKRGVATGTSIVTYDVRGESIYNVAALTSMKIETAGDNKS